MRMKFLFSISLFSVLCFATELAMKKIPNGFISHASDPQQVAISVISESEAASLFQSFAKNSDIPFKYPYDGCYARATVMAQKAEEKKIIMGKIYVEGTLIAKSDLPEYSIVEWGWHVAPVSYVKKADGKVELQVFDPGLFKGPVSVASWKNKMLDKDPDRPEVKAEIKNEYYGSRFQYFNRRKIPLQYATEPKTLFGKDVEGNSNFRDGYKSDWDKNDFDGEEWGVKAVFERYRPYQDFSAFLGKRPKPTRHEDFNNFLNQRFNTYQ